MSDAEGARRAAEPSHSPESVPAAAASDDGATSQERRPPSRESATAAFLKDHGVTLVLVVLLVAAVVWGALGVVPAKDWTWHAEPLSADLAA